MKTITTLIVAATVFNFTFAQTTPAKKSTLSPKAAPAKTAAAKPMTKEEMDAKQEKNMKAWMEYMTPGKMHKMIAESNGEWKEEITLWMTPGAPPTTTSGSCENKMIMGDRYQESTHKSEMNGMPFEGTGILGYDNAKKVFVSSWIDNMGTGIMHMEGKWDEKTNTVHFTGKTVDPMSGKDLAVREEFKMISNNSQTMEMYMTENGKEFKTMEIKFTR